MSTTLQKQDDTSAVSATLTSATGLSVQAIPAYEQSQFETAGPAAVPPRAANGWFHYSNLKVEAGIFLLVALTFAAVLGQDAITSQEFDVSARAGQYYPFVYGDKDDGGKSSVDYQASKPLEWSCTLRAGAQYSYCGYGLQLDLNKTGDGLNINKYQNLTLKVNYHGGGKSLRIMLQNAVPAELKGRVKADDTVPFVAEFNVVPGENEIHLTKDQFAVESWWLSSRNIKPAEATFRPNNVVSLAFSSGSEMPLGRFDVAVESLKFKGVSISTAQWYLIILGVWLVLTGAFLVYRFLGLKKGFEARQRQQAMESEVLASARAAAEAASAAKSQFLANMSHELRTPLNAILGYAQLLKAAELTDQQRNGVKTIHQSGEHLLTLITDILDIAKVEAGKMELMLAPTDLRTCIFMVGQMIRLRAEEKGLRFEVVIAEDVPQTVITDQKRLRQILINLLGNAVKFTASGDVCLEVSAVAAAEGVVRLRFDVVDSGIGIPADHIDRIFRPFEQSGNAVDRSGGTGLGLSITHQIVTMMQGDIRVESTPDEGSRFIVEVPMETAPALIEYCDEAVLDAPAATGTVVMPVVEAPVPPEPVSERLTAPAGALMERLVALARAGNLRAIRKEIPAILALGPQYKPFAERLDALAAAYQSPAVLRLVEQYTEIEDAA